MREYGVFNEEGMIDGPFYTHESAVVVCKSYDDEEAAYVAEICPTHEEQEYDTCEYCYDEDNEDEDEDDE